MSRLFWRDIIKSTDGCAVAGYRGVLSQIDRQAEIGQLGHPLGGYQNVPRVDVAMDQVFLPSVLEPESHLLNKTRFGRSTLDRSSCRSNRRPNRTCLSRRIDVNIKANIWIEFARRSSS